MLPCDPNGEVGATYLAKELLRESYLANDAFDARRRVAVLPLLHQP